MNSKDKQVLRRALTRAAEHLRKQTKDALAKVAEHDGKIAVLKALVASYEEHVARYEADLKALGEEA